MRITIPVNDVIRIESRETGYTEIVHFNRVKINDDNEIHISTFVHSSWTVIIDNENVLIEK
jgi:hypothetical protein